jgi:hypothetical protein
MRRRRATQEPAEPPSNVFEYVEPIICMNAAASGVPNNKQQLMRFDARHSNAATTETKLDPPPCLIV